MTESICILGAGSSGKAAARLAECLELSAKVISDDNTQAFNDNFKGCELIVVSPGIPPESPLYREAVASGIEIISELEFAARHFPGRYLAISGTNGKTTTTELTVHLLRALDINAVAAGNIGHPFCVVCVDLLTGKLPADIFPVIEVSSFQLERTRDFAPLAAVILNVAEDHLDRYPGGMDEYRRTKEKIFNKVCQENRIFGINYKPDQGNSRFTIKSNRIRYKDSDLIEFKDFNLKGRHNLENIIAALELVSRVVAVDESYFPVIKAALRSFAPGRHRLEKVFEHNGIAYIDDSKGTNPAAVAAALESIPGDYKNIRLILGGLDKDMDFSLLQGYANRIKKAYITGACREKLYGVLKDSFECEKFGNFTNCIETADREAETGDTVLLSPGCASWDMFKNYRERGERFREIIKSGIAFPDL